MNISLCWNCNHSYSISDSQCPACCASNPNIDLESAQMEAADDSHIDHDWKNKDASFDHEFGTEHFYYRECQRCGKTDDAVQTDYDYDLGN